MLGDMSGITTTSSRTLVQAWEITRDLPHSNLPTGVLSAVVVGSILIGRGIVPRVPVSLFAVVGAIAASAEFGFAERGIAVLGPVPGGLPPLGLPDVTWGEILAVLPVAASCVVMIIAQSAATSRVFAVRYHERVDDDADDLGLSAANAAAALSGAFVVNGSPTQTAMADRAGARSQIAQLVFAGVVLVVLLVPDRPAPIPAALRPGGHRVYNRRRDGRREVGLRDIRREEVAGSFISAIITAATVVAIGGVEQRAFCWQSPCRSSGTCATAIARTR